MYVYAVGPLENADRFPKSRSIRCEHFRTSDVNQGYGGP